MKLALILVEQWHIIKYFTIKTKNNNHISSAGMFVFTDVNHGYSLFLESSKDFYRCFWWPE